MVAAIRTWARKGSFFVIVCALVGGCDSDDEQPGPSDGAPDIVAADAAAEDRPSVDTKPPVDQGVDLSPDLQTPDTTPSNPQACPKEDPKYYLDALRSSKLCPTATECGANECCWISFAGPGSNRCVPYP